MKYFFKKENVEQYMSMLDGYDPTFVIGKAKEFFRPNAKVLELGMGAGIDFELLSRHFDVTGSDNSPVFVSEYLSKHKNAKVKILDAVDIATEEKFDAVYSNKVLQHLTREQFVCSIARQLECLLDDGILLFTLWHGTFREERYFDGDILFTYYTEEDLRALLGEVCNITYCQRYTEMEQDDSLLLVIKPKHSPAQKT